MIKVLVLVAEYPDLRGGIGLMYVHTRNMEYKKAGIDVDVLNFSASDSYVIDGIRVMKPSDVDAIDCKQYDMLILHAANLRNHYHFLKKHRSDFEKIVFFYHGHEIMRINHEYSKPYPYMEKRGLKSFFQDCYDNLKIAIWRRWLTKNIDKCHFIFVSGWMKNVFDKNLRLRASLDGKYMIAYNCVGNAFEEGHYRSGCVKKYDFVTIRGVLDNSKYAVDIVNRLAENTPNAEFLLIGRGGYFSHYKKAANLEWRDCWLSQEEIVKVLDQCRYALMPTRTDAQGLMMCEMAAFGIPVITSDIPVCHEVFDGFSNAFFINNEDAALGLEKFLQMPSVSKKDTRFFKKRTVTNEIGFIKFIAGKELHGE